MGNGITRRDFVFRKAPAVAGGVAGAVLGLDGHLSRAEAWTPETIVVDDFTYYRAVESFIREEMKDFETEIVLPLAQQSVKDGKLESKVKRDRAVEGYYHETPELKETFFLVRTLQEEFTNKVTSAIKELHNVYDPRIHHIFGLKQGVPTAINPNDVLLPNEKQVTISPVADPVSLSSALVMEKTGGPYWTIDNIMDNIDKSILGKSLVGMAYLVDNNGKRGEHWNPLATCMACETTVLSRLKITYRSISPQKRIIWKVSPEVEAYGKKVVDGYNRLFKDHRHKGNIAYITKDNVEKALDNAPEIIRIVNLNIDLENPARPRYYHWGIIEITNKEYAVVDFFDKSIRTTQEWTNNPRLRESYESRLIEGQPADSSNGEYLQLFLPLVSNFGTVIGKDKDGIVFLPFSGPKSQIIDMFNNPSGYDLRVESDSDKTPIYNTFKDARKAEPNSTLYVGFDAKTGLVHKILDGYGNSAVGITTKGVNQLFHAR